MKKKILIPLVILILLVSIIVGATFALEPYVPTYSIPLATMSEREVNNIKYVKIISDSECQFPLSARVKVYINDYNSISYLNLSNDGWVLRSDGYVYYVNPITEGESTTELQIQLNHLTNHNSDIDDNANMTVIFEYVKASGTSGNYTYPSYWLH